MIHNLWFMAYEEDKQITYPKNRGWVIIVRLKFLQDFIIFEFFRLSYTISWKTYVYIFTWSYMIVLVVYDIFVEKWLQYFSKRKKNQKFQCIFKNQASTLFCCIVKFYLVSKILLRQICLNKFIIYYWSLYYRVGIGISPIGLKRLSRDAWYDQLSRHYV